MDDRASVLEILRHRIEVEPFNLVATIIFLLAIAHTFLAAKSCRACGATEPILSRSRSGLCMSPSSHHQNPLALKPASLVGFFLASLVVQENRRFKSALP